MDSLIKTNSLQAWILASRPKTWAAAIAPVIVGCALAFHVGEFHLFQSVCCLLFAVTMQIAANLINDLFDFLKGSDGEDRLGPQRATAQGWITPSAMKKGIMAVVFLGCLFGLLILVPILLRMPMGAAIEVCGLLILVGIACVIFAYCYTSGPFPLAYNGLGDISVILFFGLVATGFTAYVQTLDWRQEYVLCGLAVGCVVNTLLVLNNYRDSENDAKSNKKTTIVRFGERFGRILYFGLGIIAEVLVARTLMEGLKNQVHLTSRLFSLFTSGELRLFLFLLLVSAYLVPHFRTWNKICNIEEKALLNSLIGETGRNMMIFAIILSITIILS